MCSHVHAAVKNNVNFFAAYFDKDDKTFIPDATKEFYDANSALYRQKGWNCYLTIVNDQILADGSSSLKSTELLYRLLETEEAYQAHAEELIALVKEAGYEGLEIDYENIRKNINEKTKLIEIQRSKGYDVRPTLSVEQIGQLIAFVKSVKPDVICMVDNCYGEFVETIEPSDVGADMVVGSLIKNPGGGLAPIGGYICGKKEYIENCAYRLTTPGLGKEVGASLNATRPIAQGLFLAPTVTAAALKGAIFAANVYERLHFKSIPDATEPRYDIIQAVEFGKPEYIQAFCEGIQAAAPVDSFVTPIPWDMPGYDSQVIMAAGAFISGASIELSADAPMKEPYAVYFQGGLTYPHAKFGIMMSLEKMVEKELVVC